MKAVLSSCTVLLMVLVGLPAQALEPLVLYDDFNAKFIDPHKWTGFDFGGCCSTREAVREIQNKRLRLAYRPHGDDMGSGGGGTRLHFTAPTLVTALEATVKVRQFEVRGCTGIPIPSRISANLQGFFFNTGTPTPDSHANDVFAVISISRQSDSTDPPNVLRVRAQVQHCNLVASCATSTSLGFSDLGSVNKGQKVKLLMQWDPDNQRFIFQRDDQPEVFLSYTVPDTAAPGTDSKFFDVTNGAPNCTEEPPSVAFIEAFFDDVFANESAL